MAIFDSLDYLDGKATHALSTLLNSDWSSNEVPDMTGKVAMVTGGNSGIGLELVRKLAENGAEVYMVSRTREKADCAVGDIDRELGKEAAGRVHILVCDMISLAAVDAIAHRFRKTGKQLHLLALNAGVFHPGPFDLSADGFEQTLGINYFAQVRLVTALETVLASSTPSRVVFTASHAEGAGRMNWKNLTGSGFKDSGMIPYGCAKLYMLMFARELQDRYRMQGLDIDVLACQPGVTASPLINKVDTSYWTGALVKGLALVMGFTPRVGAIPLIYAATAPQLTGKGFQYIGPNHFNLFLTASRQPINPAFKRADWRRM
ncbi:MAG: hypothetical protein WDW38_010123 [Sanguina aurantia]